LLDAALDFRLGDRETLDDLQNDVRGLVKRVEELFASLDSNLNFRVDKADTNARQTVGKSTASNELDLRGVACPMNFVKAKIRLETIPQGDVLDILLDDGEPVRNVPASFAEQGQEVLSVAGEADYFRARVRRKQ
jgi:sulfite reductase (ferredoxin)